MSVGVDEELVVILMDEKGKEIRGVTITDIARRNVCSLKVGKIYHVSGFFLNRFSATLQNSRLKDVHLQVFLTDSTKVCYLYLVA